MKIGETPAEVISFICQITGVSYSDIVSRSRKRKIADSRFLAMYFLYDKFIGKYSLKSIATMFNVNSHSSVINAIKVTKMLVETDHEFKLMFDRIYAKLNNKLVI